MYNKVILMGRICHDLELKSTPQNISVLSFRIAVDRSFQSKGEERKSDFFNVVAWRSNAEFISKYFGKGRMILVDGELQSRQYKNKDGIDITVTEIIANSVSFTGEKKAESNSINYSRSTSKIQPTVNNSIIIQPQSETDEDYPF